MVFLNCNMDTRCKSCGLENTGISCGTGISRATGNSHSSGIPEAQTFPARFPGNGNFSGISRPWFPIEHHCIQLLLILSFLIDAWEQICRMLLSYLIRTCTTRLLIFPWVHRKRQRTSLMRLLSGGMLHTWQHSRHPHQHHQHQHQPQWDQEHWRAQT